MWCLSQRPTVGDMQPTSVLKHKHRIEIFLFLDFVSVNLQSACVICYRPHLPSSSFSLSPFAIPSNNHHLHPTLSFKKNKTTTYVFFAKVHEAPELSESIVRLCPAVSPSSCPITLQSSIQTQRSRCYDARIRRNCCHWCKMGYTTYIRFS